MKYRIDFETFCSRHLETLDKNQARYNLILSILALAEKDPKKVVLWSFGSGASCAVQVNLRKVVLGELSAAHCDLLAEDVATLNSAGCIGIEGVPSVFVKSMEAKGIPLQLAMSQRIHLLDKSPKYPGSSGRGRLIREKDRGLFADWSVAFVKEANPYERAPSRNAAERAALDLPTFFWEVEGEVVSMAARNRETKNGSNISYVYTPPKFRGKGYAGSVTAFACEHAFADGKEMAFLYSDLANPISNRVYERIGFVPLCDASVFVRGK